MKHTVCLLFLLAGLASCAVPLGLGPGPIAQSPSRGFVHGSAGFAVGEKREQFQASSGLHFQVRRWFSVDSGLVSSTLRIRESESRQMVASGVIPYVRPTFYVRGVSLGVALSGLGAGGGGGGLAYGVIEPRIGYGTKRFAVYASWLAFSGSAVGGGTEEVSSTQWRVGGDYYYQLDGVRLGFALDLTRGDDKYVSVPNEGSTEPSGTFGGKYTMAAAKIRILTN